MKKRGLWRGACLSPLLPVAWIGCAGWPPLGRSRWLQSKPIPKTNSKPTHQKSNPIQRAPQFERAIQFQRAPNSKEQSNSSNPRRPLRRFRIRNCPGKDDHALMCRLERVPRRARPYKPVQLDAAAAHEAQYWSDQLNRRSACWFLYHDTNYHERMRASFPGRQFRENAVQRLAGGGAKFIVQNRSIPRPSRKHADAAMENNPRGRFTKNVG